MAAPTKFDYVPSHDLFGDFQIGSPRQPRTQEIPQTPAVFCSPRTETFCEPLNVVSPPNPCPEGPDALPLRLSCLSCRGKRYDYTAYFHNMKIFSYPPHELLKMVEESYILKNRLLSLLINYALRDTKDEDPAQIQRDVDIWEANVNNLAVTLGEDESLERLRSWVSGTMRQLREHVAGVQKMEMPSGRAKQLASEFRRLWEDVWIQCVFMQGAALASHPTASNEPIIGQNQNPGQTQMNAG